MWNKVYKIKKKSSTVSNPCVLQTVIESKVYISTVKKLMICYDICTELSNLHNKEKPHLNLNLKNVLWNGRTGYTEICDTADPDIAYTAPERKANHLICSKACDVYSFGVLFHKLLFSDESLKNCVEDCCREDPAERPNFHDLIQRMYDLILLNAFENEKNRNFWKKYFCKPRVTWEEMIKPLSNQLGFKEKFFKRTISFDTYPVNSLTDKPTFRDIKKCCTLGLLKKNYLFTEEVNEWREKEIGQRHLIVRIQCLKSMIMGKKDINIERFGKIVDMFGLTPILLQDVSSIVGSTWFHGDLDKNEAYELLKTQHPDTFLIRFSETYYEFIISYVDFCELKKKNEEKVMGNVIKHVRVHHCKDGFFISDIIPEPTLVGFLIVMEKKFKTYVSSLVDDYDKFLQDPYDEHQYFEAYDFKYMK